VDLATVSDDPEESSVLAAAGPNQAMPQAIITARHACE